MCFPPRSAVRSRRLAGFSTLVVVSLLAIFALPHDKSFLWPLCIAAGLILPFEHAPLLLLAVDCGAGRFRRYNINQFLTTAIFPIVLVVAWCLGATAVWAVVLLTIAGPVAGLACRLRVEKRRRCLAAPAHRRRRRCCARAVLMSFPSPRPICSGGWMPCCFFWLGSFTIQGYYAAAVASASLLVIAPNALAIFTFNLGARAEAKYGLKHFIWAGSGLCALQIAAAVMLALVLHPLITLVYGVAFAGAVPLALALVPAQAINGFAGVVDGYLRGRGKIAIAAWSRGEGDCDDRGRFDLVRTISRIGHSDGGNRGEAWRGDRTGLGCRTRRSSATERCQRWAAIDRGGITS